MAALTADRNTKKTEGKFVTFPVAAGTTIYAGSGVCVNASGYAVPAADTAGLVSVGIAQENVDNSAGVNGDLSVTVDMKSVFEMSASGMGQDDVMKDVYWLDDQTVGLAAAATNDIKAGKIIKFASATSVWVDPTR